MAIHQFYFGAMASQCEVRLAADTNEIAAELAQIAIDEVRRIEHKYSRYRSDSVIASIKKAAGNAWVECDTETNELLDYAESLFQISEGLFDITSGVLRQVWDFRASQLPTGDSVMGACQLIGWRMVERNGTRVKLPLQGMELDFGGFGKEYAADRAGAALMAAGVRQGYVNLAGDISVMGPKPDGSPWRIGIQHPRQPSRLVASVPISNGALATSGDYERFMDVDGKRYCHVLNPRTGWPVAHWQSVSVLAPLALTAGSLSTIAMLKESNGRAFLEKHGANYLLIDPDGHRLLPTDAPN